MKFVLPAVLLLGLLSACTTLPPATSTVHLPAAPPPGEPQGTTGLHEADLKLFYVPYREQCDVYFNTPPVFTEGKAYYGTAQRGVSDEKEWGMVKAIDPLTGEGK